MMFKRWLGAAAVAVLTLLSVAGSQAHASWLSELLHHVLDRPAYGPGYYGYYTTPGYYVTQPVPAYQTAPYAYYEPAPVAPYVAPPAYYAPQYVQPYAYPVAPQYYYRGYYAPPAFRAWHHEREEHEEHGWRGWEGNHEHGEHHEHHDRD